MAIAPLTEVELDYGYSQGFLETWLEKAPAQVKENLTVLVGGISAYREKYLLVQKDFNDLQRRYNELMAQSAQYLQFIQQQKELIDNTLIETQREFHHREEKPTIET